MHTDGDRRLPRLLPAVEPGKLRQVRPRDYLIRFAVGAAISFVAGIIGKAVSERFGGSFWRSRRSCRPA